MPVPGHLRQGDVAGPSCTAEDLGRQAVPPAPLARHQFGRRRPPGTPDGESPPGRPGDLDDVLFHRRPQLVLDVRDRHSRHAASRSTRAGPADDRRGPHDPTGVLGQGGHPRASRSVQGAPGAGCRSPAACRTSCSTNSGLPAERSTIVSTAPGRGGLPDSCSDQNRRVGLAQAFQRHRATRCPQPAQLGEPGDAAAGRDDRRPRASVTRTRTRSSVRLVARNRMRSSVERSAQCTSSTTWTSGRSVPSGAAGASTDWNSRSWQKPSSRTLRWLVDDRIRQQPRQVGERSTSWRASGRAHQPAQRLGERGERQRVAGTGTHDPANKPGFSCDTSSRPARSCRPPSRRTPRPHRVFPRRRGARRPAARRGCPRGRQADPGSGRPREHHDRFAPCTPSH